MTAATRGDRRARSPGPTTEVVAVNPADGPASIENDDDERRCIPDLLDEVRAARQRSATPARRLRHRLLRRPRPGPGPRRRRRPGARHRAGRDARRRAERGQLLGGDVDVGDGAARVGAGQDLHPQPVPRRVRLRHPRAAHRLRPRPRSSPSATCARRRWPRTAAARSYWVVRQWPSSPARSTQRLGVPVIDGVVAATLLAEALVTLRQLNAMNSAAR